jgi:phosphohistidine phosphatase
MLSLILFRHGKSDWNAPYQDDLQRPLNKRGILASKKMGTWITESNHVPELVLCSEAVRCKDTIKKAMLAGKWDAPVTFLVELYEAEPLVAFEEIKKVDKKNNSIMLVGHEPCCSGLLSLLLGGGNFVFATGSIAVLESSEKKWTDLREGSFQLKYLIGPKALPS